MTTLLIVLTFALSKPATIVTFNFDTKEECIQRHQEMVSVLDQMNEQSITVGYSAQCVKGE